MPRRTTILDQLPTSCHNCAAAGPATGRWPDKEALLGAIRMTGRGSLPFPTPCRGGRGRVTLNSPAARDRRRRPTDDV